MHRKEENHFRTIYDAATARLSAVRRIAGHAFDTIAALQRWPHGVVFRLRHCYRGRSRGHSLHPPGGPWRAPCVFDALPGRNCRGVVRSALLDQIA